MNWWVILWTQKHKIMHNSIFLYLYGSEPKRARDCFIRVAFLRSNEIVNNSSVLKILLWLYISNSSADLSGKVIK